MLPFTVDPRLVCGGRQGKYAFLEFCPKMRAGRKNTAPSLVLIRDGKDTRKERECCR